MLGVKFSIKSRDATACDWLATASTQSALPRVEVQRAEGSAIQLHETAVSEGLQAVLSEREKGSGRKDSKDEKGGINFTKSTSATTFI